MKFQRTLIAGLLVAVASSFSATAAAQDWPKQKIELIVGFAPGGGTDISARTLARHLERELGTTVVVINRPGASGSIGLSTVARAKPDGYTIGMTNMPGLVSLPIERDAGFTLDSFTFLGNLVRDPSAFSVTMDSKYKSLKDVIDEAGKRPGEINYGSTGVGTDDHLALVLFQRATDTKLNHVPYNGAGPLRTAVLGEHTEIGGMNLGEAMPYHNQSLRILAQASNERSPLAPEVPTFKEMGVDLVFASERGIVGPKGMPEEAVERLSTALKTIADNAEFQKEMKQQFTEMDYLPGDEWLARLRESDKTFRALWAQQKWVD
jgi:tripartite-type tricarboxylate transporter receptor subunit TctC